MIPRAARRALEDALEDRVRFDVPMARHTSLCVGGPADALATPADRDELARLLSTCAAHRLRHRVLGAGFNTLVLDTGLDGVVVNLGRLRRLEARPGGGLLAGAGVSHSQVTKLCRTHGLAGLEFAAGIPGSVGGWVAMNAGVPEREMKDALRELEVVSPTGAHRRRLPRASLCFRYRSLRGLSPGSVITAALFDVRPADPAAVRAEVDRHLAHRAGSQPIHVPSCGSVFKNPPGDHAGRLIEAAGLKGTRIGGAEISTVHANFIVNCGGASAADVLALIDKARAVVRDQTGIVLQPEVRVIGRRR